MGNVTVEGRRLEHKTVAITGRLASMTRDEACERLATAGAAVVREPGPDTDLLVVGQGGPPLGEDGLLTKSLRVAQELKDAGAAIEIVPEEELLARLGVEGFDLDRLYTTEQLGRILGIPRHELRAWVRQGLIEPAQVRHRLPLFGFRQVASARALAELVRSGVKPARLRASLEQLAHWFDRPEDALGQLEALESGAVGVRTADGRIVEPTGQLRLGFDESAEAPATDGVVLAAPNAPPDPFEEGLDAEDEGRIGDAIEAYRAALAAGDPRPEVAFNLGNALFSTGKLADAAAAFLRAVEEDGEFVEAWNNLGNALDALERRREAVLAYSKALAIAPDYVDAHYNLADSLAAMGDAIGARRHWSRYLEADPASPTADAVRARLVELGVG